MTNNLTLPAPILAETRTYSPYGELIEVNFTLQPPAFSLQPCPFGFQSKYYDAETGFWYYGYRFFDSRSGKWLTSDPIQEAGGLNLTEFCGGDPVNRVDALGLATWDGTLESYLANYGDRGLLLLQLFLADHADGEGPKPSLAVGSTGWFFPRAAKIDETGARIILNESVSDASAARRLHSLLASRYDTAAGRMERALAKMTRGNGALTEVWTAIDEANGIPPNNDAQQEWLATLARASRRASELQNDVRDEAMWAVASIAGTKAAALALAAIRDARLARIIASDGSPLDVVLRKLATLDFGSPRNGAVFYSGPGQGARAAEFAKRTGGMTIEMTAVGRSLLSDPVFQSLSPAEQYRVWQEASRPFAKGASGHIHAFVKGARPTGTFRTIEELILQGNRDVIKTTYHY